MVADDALDDLVRGCEAAELLAHEGLSTGRPVRTTSGDLLVRAPAAALLEHVPGTSLDRHDADAGPRMARTLARVHVDGGPAIEAGRPFEDWLEVPVGAPTWLERAIDAVRATTCGRTTWSLLHTDPAPEAFLHDATTGRTGVVDWAGARRGPVLYDVASAVMYLGGRENAAPFLDEYAGHGPLPAGEMELLDSFSALRWAVQAVYFARRVAEHDLTGIDGDDENYHGLTDARRGLQALGVDA